MSDLNYKLILTKENVSIQELPAKVQRKIADYEKIVSNPLSRNKKTNEYHPAVKVKMDDLNEDIIEGIYVYTEEKAAAAEEKRKAEEAAAEAAAAEEKRKAEEAAAAEEKRKAEEAAAAEQEKKKIQNKSWWSDWF